MDGVCADTISTTGSASIPLRLVVAFAVDDVLAPGAARPSPSAHQRRIGLRIILAGDRLAAGARKERLVSARLEKLATTEWLTGLANRAALTKISSWQVAGPPVPARPCRC